MLTAYIWALSTMNDGIADLLLHWMIGHEIGHYTLHHDYGAQFIGFEPTSAQAPKPPNKPINSDEAAADHFAFEHMPGHVKGWGHMATNYLIQQLVSIAAPKVSGVDEENQEIVLKESVYGHPNLLTRAYGLKTATGAVDFLLEEYQQRLKTSSTSGTSFTGLCSLANR